MTRRIHLLNFFGVLVLAVLCVFQWRNNRTLNLEVNHFEKVRQEQSARLTAQEKTIKGQSTDLDNFRAQLERALMELKDSETKSSAQERQIQQLSQENEALKANVAEWAAAVKARDERLRDANDRITAQASRTDEAVQKYNKLANDYNDVVRQLNEARAASPAQPAPAPPPKS